MARLRLALATLLAALAFPPAPASASPYTDVLRAYEAQGAVPPCRFSSSELEAALRGVDTYGAQYFQDFTGAIHSALTVQASGQCAVARPPSLPRQPATGTPTGAAGGAGGGGPVAAGPVTAASSASLPAPIVLMAALGAVLAVIATVAAIVRRRGSEARWAGRWRHAWAEAGYRAGGAWAGLIDRMRLR